jgi:hypothetical protein
MLLAKRGLDFHRPIPWQFGKPIKQPARELDRHRFLFQ